MFTKEDIKAAKNLPERVDIEINGKKGFVYVRGMSGTERDAWEQESFEERRKSKNNSVKNYRSSLYVRTVCDETGQLMFAPADAAWVGELPCTVLEAVIEKGQRLSGITQADAEELAKNLPEDQSEDST